MPAYRLNPLLDVPALAADRYGAICDRLAALLQTRNDVVVVQAEAVVALEAAAVSLMRPGMKALNIVTSPYGRWFGDWMRRAGADVIDITATPAKAVDLSAVAAAIAQNPDASVLSLVHAESASGICNPLAEIVALARENGLLTVVDAVASVGGHELAVDALGIDIAVIGPQKALAGPAGLSALSVSPKAWEQILKPGSPTNSILSLGDLKTWIDSGRGAMPGTPIPLEWHALDAALDRVEDEGLESMIARHRQAAEATQAGLAALGASLWADPGSGSQLITTARLPENSSAGEILKAANRFDPTLSPGVGPGAERLVRFNHTGLQARFDAVITGVTAYGLALRSSGQPAQIGAACEAVAEVYARAV